MRARIWTSELQDQNLSTESGIFRGGRNAVKFPLPLPPPLLLRKKGATAMRSNGLFWIIAPKNVLEIGSYSRRAEVVPLPILAMCLPRRSERARCAQPTESVDQYGEPRTSRSSATVESRQSTVDSAWVPFETAICPLKYAKDLVTSTHSSLSKAGTFRECVYSKLLSPTR